MKVKILLAPLLIVSTIAILVWFVYPLYTNGVDGVSEKRLELSNERNKLSKMEGKNKLIEKLSADISSRKDYKDILYQFLPESIREEEIIDNLNFLATSEGLGVGHLSVLPPISKQTDASEVLPVADPSSGTDAVLPVVPEAPKSMEIPVELTVVGDYEKMRAIIAKIFALERFNRVESMEIKKPQLSEDIKSDNLELKMVLYFSLMKKFNKEVNADDPVFSLSQLDTELIDSITNKKNVDVLKLNIEKSGRPSPFTL